VRVHEHLLSRGDLNLADRQRAQHALALDYLKAGLLDHAETALLKLEGTPFEAQARLALLANYERSRDWLQAAQIAQKMAKAKQGNFDNRLSHYLCEQAAECVAKQQFDQAESLLQEATQTAPAAARPRVDLASLWVGQGRAGDAYAILKKSLQASPSSTPLIAALLVEYAVASEHSLEALELLKANYNMSPWLDVLDAIVALEATVTNPSPVARDWYVHHLEREPSLVAAAKWIAGEKLEHEQFHPQVQRALDHAVKPLLRYRCAACGFEAKQHFWQCPGCQAWDSYPTRRVEEL
jgi:lipopolysaccharide biosynthesis regulator YciM